MELNIDVNDLQLDGEIEELGWDEGASDSPLMGSSRTKTLENYVITGLIVAKKNYLSPAYRRKDGEEIYKELYTEAIANGIKTYEELKITSSGEIEATGEEKNLKETFSLKALLALDQDAYHEIKKGAYRITATERDPEFVIVTNFEQLENVSQGASAVLDSTGLVVEDGAAAISDDKVVNVMRLRNLIQLAFETDTERIEIASYTHSPRADQRVSLGWLIPSAALKGDSNDPKITYKPYYFTMDKVKVVKLGDFIELNRAFHRSYKGERPSDIQSIENLDFIKKTLPHIDVDDLALLKVGENVETGKTLRQMELIPYEEQREEWEAMGVTEKMLSRLSAGSSGTKPVSNKQLRSIYEDGKKAFQTFKRTAE